MKKHSTLAALAVGLSWLVATAAQGQATATPSEAAPAPSAEAQAKADAEVAQKATDWVAALSLHAPRKEAIVREVLVTHLKAIRDYNNAHPYTETPAGINPTTGKPLSTMDRQIIAVSAMPKTIHESLMTGLAQQLTPAQVEVILDKYTIGKVAFTLNGYRAIVPNLTATEEEVILTNLKQAREQAVDFKNIRQVSAIFEIYKTKNEEYLSTHGRNWHELFKAYVDAANAKKAAGKANKPTAPITSPN